MKKRQIFIELTSLLDVILIMLFMIMVQAEGKTTEAVDKAKQNEDAYESVAAAYDQLESAYAEKDAEAVHLSEELEDANRMLLSRDLVTENSDILTVSILSDRRIRLQSEGRINQAIPYDWEAPNYAENRLRASLKDWAQNTDEKSLFLVFQYDRETIYYLEYEMIKASVQELKNELKKQDQTFYYIELDIRSNS